MRDSLETPYTTLKVNEAEYTVYVHFSENTPSKLSESNTTPSNVFLHRHAVVWQITELSGQLSIFFFHFWQCLFSLNLFRNVNFLTGDSNLYS